MIILAPESGLESGSIVGVPPYHLTIQHQAGDSAVQKQLVPKDRFLAPLPDDVGLLLKQGDDLLVGRHRLSREDSILGRIDDRRR